MSNIIKLETPLHHSGVLVQTNIHIENILESLGPKRTLDIVNDAITTGGTMDVYSLSERIALNTLSLLWGQAIVDNVDNEWQDNVFHIINQSKGNKNG